MSAENENNINPEEGSSLLRRDSTMNEAKNLVLMKKGDYTVHILIEEVKSLIQLNENHLPYPIVKLTVFNQSKRTEKTKVPCDSYTYDEHFYFDKADLTVEQLDSSKIIIEVFDSSNSKKRKDYFGIYEFDLEYVYSMRNHSLNNHWLTLSNPESKDMTKIRGYLKLSISVLHDNDPRVELKSDPESTSCFVPSQVKVEYEQLSIYLIRAEELPDRDSLVAKKKDRQCDPFIIFKYFGLNVESEVSKNINDVAIWNQIINIPIQIPAVSQKIVMLVKDYDKVLSNDNIGSYEISLNDVIGPENKYAEYRFIDIYGSSKNDKNKINNLMNENAEIGSAWNGRILLRIEHKKTDTPIISKVKITDNDELTKASSVNRGVMWTVHAKLYCAYYLPKEYQKYSIKIMMQDSYMLFEEKKSLNEYIYWENTKTMQYLSLSDDKEQLPDMFFYLLNGNGDPVCFQRIKSTSFYLNDQIMIIKLFPEPCYDKVKSTINSGLLKAKIVLYNTATDKNQVDLTNWKDGDSANEGGNDLEAVDFGGLGRKMKGLYTVVCVVYMSRYLVSKDSNGMNDPYVRITCVDNKQETSKKHETVNGIWNEALIFDGVELDINRKATWPILLAEVLDYDRMGSDILGSSYVWLSDSPYKFNSYELVKPKWHQLYLPKSNAPLGELLLSFYIFDQEHHTMYRQINPVPKTVDYSFEINILGLRDIKPLAMLPIKKAYIKFDMNSLNVSAGKDDTLPAKITQPKDKGSNPTINSAFKFDLKLPEDDIFMPQLQCEVYDYIFSGMLNPTLGLFLLNIKKLIDQTNQQIDEDLKAIRVKLSYYMGTGVVTNVLGGLGGLDKLIPKSSKDDIIDTSSNQNNILENSNENIGDLKTDAEIIVRTKNYDAQFIEKNKNNAEYFVVLPQYKKYFVPGSNKHKGNKTGYLKEDLNLAPSSDYYYPVGYIPKPDHNKEENAQGEIVEKDPGKIANITKHYRRYFGTDLENVPELKIKSPFHTVYLRRGKDKDVKDETAIFTALSNNKNKIIKSYDPKDDNKTYEEKEEIKREKIRNSKMFYGSVPQQSEGSVLPKNLLDKGFGKFKGVIRVCKKQKMTDFQNEIEKFKSKDSKIMAELKNVEKYEKLTKSILVKHEVIIRVYILELRDLPAKDALSDSDPYIKIYFGEEKKFDEQKNHHNDKKIASWFKHYDILSMFPGDSTLRIEVWDYNPIFRDELIGSTSIDLEDRYFNSEWQQLKFKPIEVRSLTHPDISGKQGNISLWVEIFDRKDSINMTPWQIAPEPLSKVELRLVVWETEEMRMMDAEDTSDIYVTAFVDPKDKQSTDVHYRCQTGNASFNWRIVLPLDVPRVNNRLTLHCYDKDIFSKDDFISGAEIDLTDILKIPKDLDVPITFSKDYVNSVSNDEKMKYEGIEFLSGGDDEEKNKFWVQCYQQNAKSGRILCSLEILPMWKAELNKVGKGRKEPNVAPYLPPPVGRFQWSLNPFTLLNQCVGPRFRKKLYWGVCMLCCIIYLIFLIPYIIYHLSGQIFNPFNW